MLKILKQIVEKTDYKKSFGFSKKKHPTQGQFVITGIQMPQNIIKRVGYVVQIREKCGQFGSDLYFLRHADGELTTHENQNYFEMTEEQEQLARSIFKYKPEEEDFSLGYRCCDKIEEIGYIIEKSESKPSPDIIPMTITTKEKKEDGSIKTTITTII